MMYTYVRKMLGVLAIGLAGGISPAVWSEDIEPATYRAVAGLSGRVAIVATTELASLAEKLAARFRTLYPGVETSVVTSERNPLLGPGTDTGSASVVLSHALSEQEASAIARSQGHPLAGAVAAADAVAIFVHKDNPLKQLTLPQVDALFSADRRCGYKTELSTWKDLGLAGDWAAQEVPLFGPAAGSETSQYIRRAALCGGGYKRTLTALPTGSAITLAVAESIYGVGIASVTERSPGVRAMPIARRGTDSITIGRWLIESHGIPTADTEAYAPSADNIRLGNYPLARPVHVYVPGTAAANGSQPAAEMIRFVFSNEGQEIAAALGYVRLPAGVAADGLRTLGLQ